MGYILDTSILIEIDNDNKALISSLAERIPDLESEDFFITCFGFCEYLYGHIKKNEKNKEIILENIRRYKLLNTSYNSAITFCDLRNQLKEDGKEIPVFDLLSASIAVSSNMAFVTTDRHFKQVPRLKTVILEA